VPAAPLPAAHLLREHLDLPEVSEIDVMRHFVRLSQMNYSIDSGFYPLGSCTMKYNPKINDRVASLFADLHPKQPQSTVQGALTLLAELEGMLAKLTGMDAVTLQPAAGAQAEFTAILMFKAYHQKRGEGAKRHRVIVPDTAHGTNPASAAMCGFQVTTVKSDAHGNIDLASLKAALGDDVVGLMLTNPNTLGLFEEEIEAVAAAVHARGGLVYMDGANFNALMGVARPGDMGVDVMQFNLHKTFSTPHGGGGPGAGPVAVRAPLAEYLPVPRLVRREAGLAWTEEAPKSVGRMRSFYGNFGVLVRAFAYIARLGAGGLSEVTRLAVLNANYVRARLRATYHLPYDTPSLHECVFSDRHLQDFGVSTLDVAKRLLDYGFYAPTIYFPLVVKGALMIEPTETETRETLDRFVEALTAIADEARTDPSLVRNAPQRTVLARLDETRAARRPILRWHRR